MKLKIVSPTDLGYLRLLIDLVSLLKENNEEETEKED